MTYARARLWTGVLGVGSFVLISIFLLATNGLGSLLEGTGGTFGADFGILWTLLAAAAIGALPFDIAGGYILPRRFGRPHPSRFGFAAAWLRGVLVLITLSSAIGALMLAGGRAAGFPGALSVFVLASVALLVLQEPIARFVGGLRRASADGSTIFLRTSDPAFSGGFDGLSGSIVLPESWSRRFEPRQLERLTERRRRIHASGARRQALLFALAWNATGFGFATLLPHAGIASVAEIVNASLGFTLWTFLGLLLLPTPSRRATFAMDALAATNDAGRRELGESIRRLDALQDDEPERSPGVETVFHPVPSVARRIGALRSTGAPQNGPWNLARTALYLAHAGMTPLPRAVHCNVGRPQLWVYLPSDG